VKDPWSSPVSAAKAALDRIQDAGQRLDLVEMQSAAKDFEDAIQQLSRVVLAVKEAGE
jgi:hypothetical protein